MWYPYGVYVMCMWYPIGVAFIQDPKKLKESISIKQLYSKHVQDDTVSISKLK